MLTFLYGLLFFEIGMLFGLVIAYFIDRALFKIRDKNTIRLNSTIDMLLNINEDLSVYLNSKEFKNREKVEALSKARLN